MTAGEKWILDRLADGGQIIVEDSANDYHKLSWPEQRHDRQFWHIGTVDAADVESLLTAGDVTLTGPDANGHRRVELTS